MNNNPEMFRHKDYRHMMQVRVFSDTQDANKMIIEGKAVTFDDPTVLFEYGGIEYKEIIASDAFRDTDLSKAYLKYNHSNAIMAMARYKNGTLKIDIRSDGVYIQADLANTTAGRDLYELVKRGDIDKMSFAFTIREESYDEKLHTWTVLKVDRLYDVAAVEVPAYDNTDLFARRYDEVEAKRRKEVEALNLQRKRQVEIIRLRINTKKNS